MLGIFLKGMIIGVANIIPGVSGGTIAVVLNIYDQLIYSLDHLLDQWKESFRLLVPLLLGAGLGILLFSKLIQFLLTQYPAPTNFFFIGLIIGTCPLMISKATTNPFHWSSLFAFFIALGAIVLSEQFLFEESQSIIITQPTILQMLLLVAAGMMGSSAMIIPGVSGSFLLLLLGVYSTILVAISSFNLWILLPVGIGIVLGIVLTSKLINFLLQKYPQQTYFAILGFIVASIFTIYPGWSVNFMGLLSVVSVSFGIFIAFVMQK